MKKISIIIPFCDRVDLLNQCVSSVLEKSTYKDFEVILVNNNSKEEETQQYLKEIKKNDKVRILEYNKPFNFSAINNFAAKYAKGEFLLFLNNDTAVISENWFEEMLGCFNDERVGVVGAKLLYANGTIQHMGVILEEKRLAIHAFRTRLEVGEEFNMSREWSAVTAACMLTRKELFERVGGFDEKNFSIAYNDVDYCLKLRALQYKIICTPKAELYHYESATRKADVRVFYKFLKSMRFLKSKKLERYRQFLQEQAYMRKKWSKEIANDPFYNQEFI